MCICAGVYQITANEGTLVKGAFLVSVWNDLNNNPGNLLASHKQGRNRRRVTLSATPSQSANSCLFDSVTTNIYKPPVRAAPASISIWTLRYKLLLADTCYCYQCIQVVEATQICRPTASDFCRARKPYLSVLPQWHHHNLGKCHRLWGLCSGQGWSRSHHGFVQMWTSCHCWIHANHSPSRFSRYLLAFCTPAIISRELSCQAMLLSRTWRSDPV